MFCSLPFQLQENRILPLLDGLDELDRHELHSKRRKVCVKAINDFIENSLVGLVACCRWREYEQLHPLRLKLNAAIRLQSRTDSQVAERLQLLDPTGKHLAGLQKALQLDSTLRIAARTMVNFDFMIGAYWDQPAEAIVGDEFKGVEARQKKITGDFVDRRLHKLRKVM